MSRYDHDEYDPDAPVTTSERDDYRAWRAQRDAEAEARRPKPIDYANSEDPRAAAFQLGKQTIADGGTEADGLAVHFGALVAAAKAGDKRVIIEQ